MIAHGPARSVGLWAKKCRPAGVNSQVDLERLEVSEGGIAVMHKTTGVIAAMTTEVDTLLASKAWRGRPDAIFPAPDDDRYLITCAGVGAENARMSAERMVSRGVAALVSIGMAGGLAPELATGHIVIATDVVQVDADTEAGSWPAHARGAAGACVCLTENGLDATCGTIVTVAEPVLTRRHKESLFQQTGALAVDMESSAVARVASQACLPFLGLRVVCDPARMSLAPELVSGLKPDGSVRYAAILQRLAQRPTLVRDMVSLARAFARARKSLGLAWHHLVEQQRTQTLMDTA